MTELFLLGAFLLSIHAIDGQTDGWMDGFTIQCSVVKMKGHCITTSQCYNGQYARICLQIVHNCSCHQHLQQKSLTAQWQMSETVLGMSTTSLHTHTDVRQHHWQMAAAMMTWSNVAHSISVTVSVCPDWFCVFHTPSLAVFPTCCNQLDSNLVNLEAAVEMG